MFMADIALLHYVARLLWIVDGTQQRVCGLKFMVCNLDLSFPVACISSRSDCEQRSKRAGAPRRLVVRQVAGDPDDSLLWTIFVIMLVLCLWAPTFTLGVA